MSAETKQRPPRLRNACLDCTAAKVKCSGEKTGCSRCTKTKSKCVYLESMAGRVPRAPRKQSWVNIPFEGPHPPARSSPSQSVGGRSESSNSSRESMSGVLSFPEDGAGTAPPQILSDDFLLHPSTPDAFPTDPTAFNGQTPLFQLFPTSTSDAWPGYISDDNHAGYFQHHDEYMTDASFPQVASTDDMDTSPSTSTSGIPGFSQGDWAASGGRQQLPLDKQCVLAATQIINVLENTIDDSTQTLDVVLEVVRKAGVGLNGLIGLQQQSRQQRCLALYGAILHQILDLMETNVWRLEMDGSGGSDVTPHPTHNGAVLHQLDSINELISSYRVPDARPSSETIARARRLLSEIEFSMLNASRAKELADHLTSSTRSGRPARSCFEGIEYRLGLLRTRLYGVIVKMMSSPDSISG
ncbi:hypothetical protein QBC35DRAFT_90071 [Podospora australis]|uniref:Zn(2)-C6 fungal-type domain-containing protein n=1 Tax=Podospora australis TaxID=1536484 RepID=A0AAN6WKG6_9PEZI|nr:hypothetical protein QBC35DRAFT_90071 [Podospora australis]